MTATDIFQAAEHERVYGDRKKAYRLYAQVINDIDFRRDHPDLYFDTLKMAAVVARLLGEYAQAYRYEEMVYRTAEELGKPLYDFWRDAAECRRKRAASMAPNDSKRFDLLIVARDLLEDSIAQIEALEIARSIDHGTAIKEKAATMYHQVRLMVTSGNSWNDIIALSLESASMLEYAPHEKLYQGLDQAEIFAYYGQGMGSRVFWPTIRQLLWSSWRYGNRRPPLHFERALLNLVALCLPMKPRRLLLERYGRLIPGRPKTSDYV